MNRVDRLSAILNMLQSSSSVKVMSIADRFQISKRTVYRDLQALAESGIPIAGDGYEGYSLVEGYKLPPLMFTRSETLALLVAKQIVNTYTDSLINLNYNSAMDKIKAVIKSTEKDHINEVSDIINACHSNLPIQSLSTIDTIVDQIIKNKRIRIQYFSYHVQCENEREIDPIGVFFSQSNWYLIAYCHGKRDYRTFHLRRIRNIILTETPINHDHPSFKTFLKKLGHEAKMQKIILRTSKQNYPIMDEDRYYHGLIEERSQDDYIDLHFMTFSIRHFARWYLSYTDIAEVIYPDELKQIARQLIDNSLL